MKKPKDFKLGDEPFMRVINLPVYIDRATNKDGHALNLRQMKRLRAWLDRAIKYMECDL